MSWLDTFAAIRETDWSKVPEPERETQAREVVTITAYGSAASSAVLVPFVDLALLLPIHTAMVMTVGSIYGRKLSSAEAKRVAVELGAIAGVTLAGHAALSLVKKLIPGLGWVTALATAASSFAITWGFGQLTVAYFKHPELSREDLTKVFKDAMAEGANLFSKDAFDRFRSEHADEVPQPEPEAEPEAAAPEASDAPEPEASPEDHEKAESMRPKKRSL